MPIWQLCANLLIPNSLRSNLSYSPLAALEPYVKQKNISYYKNALIILSFGLFLLNLQIIAIVMQMKRINRLKIVLAEQGKTGKWLAHALGKNESTVSRWCTNEVQPSVETLLTIAETLKIDIKELLCSTQMCNQDDGIQI